MIVTPTQRETIHNILNQMLIGIRGNTGIIFLYEGNRELGISQEEGQFLRAVMQSEGLVTNADGPNQNNLSELTAKGYSIARSPGGYRAYIQQKVEQQQQQQNQEREQLELNRKSAAATVSSTRVAKASAWIAALSLVATMIATYIAYQANADSTNASARLQKLEAQVQQLKRNQTESTASRER
jgi:ATPase subunit of ABC transporter with duplicated ATPase domains